MQRKIIKLPRSFYQREPQIVAKELLGKFLFRKIAEKFIVVEIVETEAYGGKEDKGCHILRYGYTKKTATLFGEVGRAYVYPVHINMFCLNAVAHRNGEAGGVLIRAGKPLEGTELILKNLKINSQNYNITKLLNGPAKLCKALKINSALNGENLLGENLFIAEGEKIEENNILTTKRVNIPYAEEAKDYLWRYIIKDNPFLSKAVKIKR